MDTDRCDNTPLTLAERFVCRALEMMLNRSESDFIAWAERSADVRRHLLESDTRMQFEPWTLAIVRAQHLCRVIESRIACFAQPIRSAEPRYPGKASRLARFAQTTRSARFRKGRRPSRNY